MLKLAVIGTSWISAQFAEAAHESGQYELTAVYSRSTAHGEKFVADLSFTPSAHIFTDLATMYATHPDVVYIASPNSLHFKQAQMALTAGLNVIVEKPMCSNPSEMRQLQATLRQHPTSFLLEAARHTYLPTYQAVKQIVKAAPQIQGATLTYMRYSSKYDAYLDGRVANVFTTQFSGGALQDIGVYPVHDAIGWFGVPQSVSYHPDYLATGADASGVGILHYPDFNVVIQCSKRQKSASPSEIYLGKNTLQLAPNAADLLQVKYAESREVIAHVAASENPLLKEAQHFAALLTAADQNQALDQARIELAQTVQVNRILYAMRQSCGLEFPADQHTN